ncbi:MAG: GTPase [Nanoarchaeota archaeon]
MHPFQTIPVIEKPDTILDIAFSKTKKKTTVHPRNWDHFQRKQADTLQKITVVRDDLAIKFTHLLKAFPSFNTLPLHYQKLAELTLDLGEVKHALGALNWAVKQINDVSEKLANDVRRTRSLEKLSQLQRAFFGRVSNIVKKVKIELGDLEAARKIIKSYPLFKEQFTVCIVGFPNVGKSTLLGKLTTAKPEIDDYAFTTRSLNLGYGPEIQYVDTPGTLSRLEKMNPVEKQAFIAMKYLADAFISVIDLTELYPLKDQMMLHKNILAYGKPTIIYLSKTDMLTKEMIREFHTDEAIIYDIDGLKDAMKTLRNKTSEYQLQKQPAYVVTPHQRKASQIKRSAPPPSKRRRRNNKP